MRRFALILAGAMALLLSVASARAVTIETVPVGNPGNPADTRYVASGVGGVNYAYRIGKYEVTAGQYCEFLNAVAATDTYGLYNEYMAVQGTSGMIVRAGSPGSYTYTSPTDYANRPVSFVSWGDAARFCNWLHNGQPTGAQDASTTEDGAYDLSATQSYYGVHGETPTYGSDDYWARNAALMAVNRRPGATWALPTRDEWHKAAYHKNDGTTGNYFDYPTGSDAVPSNFLVDPDPGNNANFYRGTLLDGYTIGPPYYLTQVGEFENSASPYGTFDQGGNVREWTEASNVGVFTRTRVVLGGGYDPGGFSPSGYWDGSVELRAFGGTSNYPSLEYSRFGIRLVYVPEPNAMVLTILSACCWPFWRRNCLS